MIVSVLHDCLDYHGNPDERDTFHQAMYVSECLAKIGIIPKIDLYNGNSGDILSAIHSENIELVFNLVENFSTGDFRPEAVPELLEKHGIPFTGSGSRAVIETTDKVLAKEKMKENGIPTADWINIDGTCGGSAGTGKYIIKPVSEDASVGIDSASVVEVADIGEFLKMLEKRSMKEGKKYFGEKYIGGREFNVSLISSPGGVEVMPVAELLFKDWGIDEPRILGYDAKWESESESYIKVTRSFDFADVEKPLIDNISGIAEECWKIFGLGGYGRVDFRVDESGRPFVLEVNTNPCLSHDAGFFAASERNMMSFEDVLQRIIEDAFSCHEKRLAESAG